MHNLSTLPQPSKFDVISANGRVGLILLATDFNSEKDLHRILPEGVQAFTNRVSNRNPLTLENLQAMAASIPLTAADILPGKGVDVMIYGCTSGSVAIGHEKIEALIHQSCPNTLVTNPLVAVDAALAELKIDKLSVLTPYTDQINVQLADWLVGQNYQLMNLHGFGMDDDIDITAVPLKTLKQAAIEAMHPQAEGLFISCTALRACLIIEELEQAIGKPVITSNQVLAWHALKLLGYSKSVTGYGRLLTDLQ